MRSWCLPAAATTSPEQVLHRLRREHHRRVEGRVVLGHLQVADLREIGAREALEVGVQHDLAELPRAVAAEVEEENAVAVGDERPRFLHADERGHELVGFLLRVLALHRGHDVVGVGPLAEENQLPRELDALPAVVAVHRVVAADDRRDFARADFLQLGLKLGQVMLAAGRRGVAAIEERVDENLVRRDARVLRDLDQRVEMFLAGMDAAVGKQAPEMQRAVARP